MNEQALANLRGLPVRAQRIMKTKIATELGPILQQATNDLFEQGPLPVDSPFTFGSDLSKRFYHWLVTVNPSLSDGSHWIRNGDIERAFVVEVSSTRCSMGMIQVRNTNPDAKFVFGPWLVEGHRRTGWPDQADVVRYLLRERALEWLRQEWPASWREAAKGEG